MNCSGKILLPILIFLGGCSAPKVAELHTVSAAPMLKTETGPIHEAPTVPPTIGEPPVLDVLHEQGSVTMSDKMEAIEIHADKVVPYAVLYNIDANSLWLVDPEHYLAGSASTGSGVIWAEAGFWHYQVIEVSGDDITKGGSRRGIKMIFEGLDSVRVVLQSRTGRKVILEVYTHRGGWLDHAQRPSDVPSHQRGP